MAQTRTAATAAWAASMAPRARELARDREFRSHAGEVIASADRLRSMLRGDRRLIAQRLLDDQDVQREIGLLVGEARAAADRARRKRRSRLPRILLLVGIAAIAVPVVRMLLQRRREQTSEFQAA